LAKPGTAISGASQVWRFINEVAVGDWVATYSYDATDTETKRLVPLKQMYWPA
jgi:predicted Mrr-cat superfamily restriction endonuclease